MGGMEGRQRRSSYLGRRRQPNRERVPTSVQRLPQAPSEPSEGGGPAKGAARRALLALQKPAWKTRADRWRPAGARRIQVSRSRRPGRDGLGGIRAATIRARAAAGSEPRQMPAASCTSHAPFASSALLLAPVPALFFHAEPGWGEGPTPGAPGCPASAAQAPGPGRAHTLPLSSNLQASMAGRSPRVAGRCGGLGAQAVVCGSGGQLPSRLRAARSWRSKGSEPGAPGVPTTAAAPGAGDPQQCGAAWEPRRAALAALPLFLSLADPASHPLSRDVSPGGGVSVNPLLAPTRPAQPWPGLRPRACTSQPQAPPAASVAVGSRSGPLASEMPLESPFGRGEGWRAGCPTRSLTKGGSDP